MRDSLEKLPELELVGARAGHEDGIAQAIANRTEECDKELMTVDMNLDGFTTLLPCSRLASCPATKTGLIKIDDRVVVGDGIAEEHGKLPALFIRLVAVHESVAVHHLSTAIGDVVPSVEPSECCG